MGSTTFTAIALDGAGHGAVASGGLLLVTSDGGKTWHAPVFRGPAPGAAFNDIALRGSVAVAVGDEGMIYDSDDAGATWRRVDSPTDATLTSVAIAGGGTAVAGSSAGEILVGTAGDWAVAGTAAGSVRAVAASPDPVWGDGQPDLVAATGADVLGSDDALTFATLPGLPAPGAQPWSAVAWSGVPARSLLIAGVSAGRLLPDRGPELGRRRFGPLRRHARRHAGRPERRPTCSAPTGGSRARSAPAASPRRRRWARAASPSAGARGSRRP